MAQVLPVLYIVRYDHADFGQGISGVFTSLAAAEEFVIDGWQDATKPEKVDEGADGLVYSDEFGNVETIHIWHGSVA